MPQLGFAVVSAYLIGGKPILFLGSRFAGIVFIRIEGVDNQRTVHLDRFLVLFIVEIEATAKPAYARLSTLIQNRIGPHGQDPIRQSGLLALGPREPLGQIQFRATQNQE